MAGIFLFFLIIAFAFNLFSKDKKYSESENRMLAQKPEFSMANLASGKYMKDMEDYVTDQFFIRDKWINLKVLEDLALGKRESNGVYIGKLASGKYMKDMEDYVTDQFFIRDKWINLKVLEDLALGKRESNGVYIGKKDHLMEIPTAPNQKALDNNLRDKWINLKVLEDLALGKRESNGVYIGKKDHLMEIPTAPNQKALDNNLDAISNFSASHPDINTVMTLIPNAAYVYNHLVPRNAPVRDQEADIKYVQSAVGTSLNFVDLTKTMTLIPNAAYVYNHLVPRNAPVRDQEADIKYVQSAVGTSLNFVDLTKTITSHKDEEIYYKTDHHWTTLGAKYAFDALSTALGIDSPTQEYTIYPVTHSFQGTLTSKSGYDKGKDTIELYIPQNVNTDCLVNFVDEGKRTASMYESAALENKDKYEVFFGGNHSRVDISTPMEGKKNLLLFKDSYANCFIPFLVPYYRNIIVIDPRYYYDNIESLITDNEITDILFLYNVNTFLGDTSLGDVLAAE